MALNVGAIVATMKLDMGTWTRDIKAVEQQVQKLQQKTASVTIRINANTATVQLERLNTAINKVALDGLHSLNMFLDQSTGKLAQFGAIAKAVKADIGGLSKSFTFRTGADQVFAASITKIERYTVAVNALTTSFIRLGWEGAGAAVTGLRHVNAQLDQLSINGKMAGIEVSGALRSISAQAMSSRGRWARPYSSPSSYRLRRKKRQRHSTLHSPA
jgi:hypothetical protein